MQQFGVLTFNLLAQKYVREEALSDHVDKRKLLDPVLRFATLKSILMPHLEKVDVVCLQEVDLDLAPDIWVPWFQSQGFNHVLQTRRHTVGCATFYRENRFRLVWKDIRSRALLTSFASLNSDDVLSIVNVHLEGKASESVRRIEQITSAMRSLSRHLHDTMNPRIIVCGDFNSFNVDGPFQLLTTGILPKGFTEDDVVLAPETDIKIPFTLTSAFETAPITYISKRRATTIDWLLYSPNSIKCVDSVQCVDEFALKDMITRTRLPTAEFPSDHLPIAATFELIG